MLERMQDVFEGVPIGPSVMLSDHFQSAALAGTTVIHRSPSSAAAASYRNVTEFVVRAVEARQRRPATRIMVGA
jgi:nitrogenase subunit NifH